MRAPRRLTVGESLVACSLAFVGGYLITEVARIEATVPPIPVERQAAVCIVVFRPQPEIQFPCIGFDATHGMPAPTQRFQQEM